MLLSEASTLAVNLLIEHGIYPEYKFRFDNAKRRAGCCSYRKSIISLSRYYVVANNEDKIKDTILHEIAHALTPGAGHGPDWKRMCIKIGAKPERCYDSKDVNMPLPKYFAECGGCLKIYRKHRVKILNDGRYRYCPKCGPNLGRLEFKVLKSL